MGGDKGYQAPSSEEYQEVQPTLAIPQVKNPEDLGRDFFTAVGAGAITGALMEPNTVASGILLPTLGFNTDLDNGLMNRDYGSQDGSDYNKDGTNYN